MHKSKFWHFTVLSSLWHYWNDVSQGTIRTRGGVAGFWLAPSKPSRKSIIRPNAVVVYKPVQLSWLFKQNTIETSNIYFVLDMIIKCKSWIHLQNSPSWVLCNTYLKIQKRSQRTSPTENFINSFYSFLTFSEKGLMPPKHFFWNSVTEHRTQEPNDYFSRQLLNNLYCFLKNN